MLEILFLFGLMGWLMGAAWDYLSELAAFPTILVSFAAVPLITVADYLATLHRLELEGINQRRVPIPPERFYWHVQRTRLGWSIFGSLVVAVLAWWAALTYPADFVATPSSVGGWFAGALACYASGRGLAHAVVYVRASQWFDKMTPWAAGFFRRALYRLSDNPDFLDPVNPRKREKEKSIY